MMGWMAPERHLAARMVVDATYHQEEPSMSEVTTIGLDLAKHVFQVHGTDASGATVLRKQLRRGQVVAFFAALPRCLVGLEACATAHYWARELQAVGHEVRLMPAQYVKAYDKRNKNDGGCGGDLRGGKPAEHALCGDQDGRAAGSTAAAPRPGKAGSAAPQPGQHAAGASGRVRGDRAARVAQRCASAGSGAPGAASARHPTRARRSSSS
jgi:hypothetical protein